MSTSSGSSDTARSLDTPTPAAPVEPTLRNEYHSLVTAGGGDGPRSDTLARAPDTTEQRAQRVEAAAGADAPSDQRVSERQADELVRPPADPDAQRERANLGAWQAVGGIRSGPATFFVPGKPVGLEEPRWKPGH